MSRRTLVSIAVLLCAAAAIIAILLLTSERRRATARYEAALATIEPADAPLPADTDRIRYEMRDGRGYAVIDLGKGMTLTLVRIPAGSFLMGSPPTEAGRYESEALHPVVLTENYWIGESEVTVAQFRRFVEETGYKTLGQRRGWAWGWDAAKNDWGKVDEADWAAPTIPQQDDHPVVSVTWGDAMVFGDWLTEWSGLPVSLPTEAQWECAARAGTGTRYWWGDGEAEAEGRANVAGMETRKAFGWDWTFSFDDATTWTASVNSFEANPYGLYDVSGNVWEWCQDWLVDYRGLPEVNPAGPESGEVKAIRGGSWGVFPNWLRSAQRGFHVADDRVIGLGFRVASTHSTPASPNSK